MELKSNHERVMGKIVGTFLIAFLSFVAACYAEGTGKNLFPDPEFQRGFRVIDGPKTLGTIHLDDGANAPTDAAHDAPLWTLAQHYSRFNLTTATPKRTADGAWEISTPGSLVRLTTDVNGEKTLTLGVFAEEEYETPRVRNQAWPHLLLTTDFPKDESVLLAEDAPVTFSADLRIAVCENKMTETDYNADLHCGQVSAYFILRNAAPDSPDGKDYVWFGIPVFDSRRDFPPPYAALDGDPTILGTGKLIWLPGGEEALNALYGGRNPRSGQWVHVKANLNDYVAAALAEAKRRNFLTHTEPSDLEISHFNLGWEVPGTFHAILEIKNLRLSRR